MAQQEYHFQAVVEAVPDKGGAFVRFPWDIRKEFGAGRVKVEAAFDGVPYSGSIVNMGVKNEDGSICYILGVRKDILAKVGKKPGDGLSVDIRVVDSPKWVCPRCGRSFSHTNADHYCADAPKTIDEYIARQPEDVQPRLNQLRDQLRTALPDAQEKMSWQMPTFWNGHNLIHFACFKKHIGLYPGPEAVEHFAEALATYKCSKGTIQFPHDRPLPLELIAEIARWCAR